MLPDIEQISELYITATSLQEAGQMNVKYSINSHEEHAAYYYYLYYYEHFHTILTNLRENGEINESFDFMAFFSAASQMFTQEHKAFLIHITKFLSFKCCQSFLQKWPRITDKFYLTLLKRMVILVEQELQKKN